MARRSRPLDASSPEIRAARAHWRYRGVGRPPFAAAPAEGQESVWDYPRPPRVEPDPRPIRVCLGDWIIAQTRAALRVLETASPPTYYLPPDDVDGALLRAAPGSSVCEWKGRARYWSVVTNERTVARAAWSYEEPFEEFLAIRGYLAFYPSRLRCEIDGEVVSPQPGGLYGGWITDNLVGPFKGESGSEGW